MVSVAPPPLSTSSSYSTVAERLQRKAELAKEARLRKKQYEVDLRARCSNLEAELEDLKRQRPTPFDSSEQQKQRHLQQIKSKLTPYPEPPLVNQAIELYVNSQHAQRAALNEIYDRIGDTLSQSLHLHVALACAAQIRSGQQPIDAAPTSAPCNGSTGGSTAGSIVGSTVGEPRLLQILKEELQMTDSQLIGLANYRQEIESDRRNLLECESMLTTLRHQTSEHINSHAAVMQGVRNILSPVQTAKFLVWLEQNQAGMELLCRFYEEPDPTPELLRWASATAPEEIHPSPRLPADKKAQLTEGIHRPWMSRSHSDKNLRAFSSGKGTARLHEYGSASGLNADPPPPPLPLALHGAAAAQAHRHAATHELCTSLALEGVCAYAHTPTGRIGGAFHQQKAEAAVADDAVGCTASRLDTAATFSKLASTSSDSIYSSHDDRARTACVAVAAVASPSSLAHTQCGNDAQCTLDDEYIVPDMLMDLIGDL